MPKDHQHSFLILLGGDGDSVYSSPLWKYFKKIRVIFPPKILAQDNDIES